VEHRGPAGTKPAARTPVLAIGLNAPNGA
jgi:hypothetical protein